MKTSHKAAMLAGGALVAIMILFGCEEISEEIDITALFGNGRAQDSGDDGQQPPGPNGAPGAPVEQVDHVAAFKQHVMIDRTREPDWLGNVTHVRVADGMLFADTTLAPGWRDSSRPSRPAESICTQLFAYAQRGAKLTWTTITVKASDGSALVTRQGVNGSCKQT